MRLRFGSFTFDSDVRELSRSGQRIALTPKAFSLLESLITARPQPVSRESLSRLLWPDTFVEPGNLHNLISEIRGALGDDKHEIIRTVHRFGYSFDATGAIEEGARFVVVIGRDEIPLRPGENTIGRDHSDTIVINAPEVSRGHARLIVDGSRVILEDLNSKNGTFLGSRRLTAPAEVKPDDEILIGTTRITIREHRMLPSTKTAK